MNIRQHIIENGSLVLPWFKKGTWTILDQGLFAGSNFVLNILLVRWLTPEAFGAFTVAFSIFILLGLVHTGLLTEPMLVFGPGRFKYYWRAYLKLLLQAHIIFAVLAGLVLAVAVVLLQGTSADELAQALLTLTWVQACVLFLWMMRSSCYVRLQPQWAASGGMIYATLVLSMAYILEHNGWLSASTALSTMGGSGLVAGFWILSRHQMHRAKRPHRKFKQVISRRHWRYGRWSTGAAAVHLIPEQLSYLVLPLWTGLAGSAALKALMNFIMPVVHVFAALSNLMVPTYVRLRGTPAFNRLVLFALPVAVLVSVVYWIMVGWFAEPLIQWVYNGRYIEYAGLLWLVGGIPLKGAVGAILRAALTALERPDRVFWAYFGSAAAVLTLGVYLIYQFGVLGAVWSALLQMALEIALLIYYFVQVRSHTSPSSVPVLHDPQTPVSTGPKHPTEPQVVNP